MINKASKHKTVGHQTGTNHSSETNEQSNENQKVRRGGRVRNYREIDNEQSGQERKRVLREGWC